MNSCDEKNLMNLPRYAVPGVYDLFPSPAYELNPKELAEMNIKQSHSILSSNLDSNISLLLLFINFDIMPYKLNLLIWFCHKLI